MQKIRVTVLAGPPGPLLAKVLSHLANDAGDWLVLGPAAVLNTMKHALPVSAIDDAGAAPTGCDCCSVRGPLVDALRDHFLQAVQRRRAPYRQVLCVQESTFDPAGLVAALGHDAFLSQRYHYGGCLTVVQGRAVQSIPPAWLLADVLLTDCPDEAMAGMLFSINPWARRVPVRDLPATDRMLLLAEEGALLPRPAPLAAVGSAGGRAGSLFSPVGKRAGQVFQLSVSLPQSCSRGRLYAALDGFLESPDVLPLRLQGLVQLQPGNAWYVLRALRRHRQPLRELSAKERCLLDQGTDGPGLPGAGGFLCLLQSEHRPEVQAASLADALAGHYRLLSPENNPQAGLGVPGW